MATLTFLTLTTGQLLEQEGYGTSLGELGYKLMSADICGTTRWDVHYNAILKARDGTFWSAYYQVGATESQDTDYDTKCELTQVYPTLVITTEYKVSPGQDSSAFTAEQARDAMGQIAAAKFSNLTAGKGDVVLILPAFANQRPWTEEASQALMQALHPMEGLMIVIPPGAGIQSLNEAGMNAEGWYRRESK